MKELAPIALFAYRRPRHTEQTIAALRKCPESQDSDLVVFLDGPRTDPDHAAVEETRSIAHAISGFRSVRCVERERNFGLCRNIVEGVQEVLERSERVVVLEDDIEVAPDFLRFMNQSLEHFAPRQDIWSISGYLYPVTLDPEFAYDAFLFSRFSCWGWATWRSRWSRVDWKAPARSEFLGSPEFWRLWNVSNDLPEIMLDLIDGRNDSWAVRFNLAQIKQDGYSVHPVRSLARNLGFDGTGTHSHDRRKPEAVPVGLARNGPFRFADSYDDAFVEPLRRYFAHGGRRKLKNLILYGRYF